MKPSSPLRIASVTTPLGGRIGITIAPGKKDPDGMSGAHDRDLGRDLDAVRNWGASAVVTVMELSELTYLQIAGLGEAVRQRSMEWYHLPVVDVSIPDQAGDKAWNDLSGHLRVLLANESDVLVHCRGGLGRSGMIVARLLVEMGLDAETAIRNVRSARPGAIETTEQSSWVRRASGSVAASSSGRIPGKPANWFAALTGFQEVAYADTKGKLKIQDGRLISLVNGASHGIGTFELANLDQLRQRVASLDLSSVSSNLSLVKGDVRDLHRDWAYAGGLFQVASQFNMLEMISPTATPEDGVGIYANDPTQGPACAIAAGAATIYRNYFVPVGTAAGQTSARQLNGFEKLGASLANLLGSTPSDLWTMQNGYLRCSRSTLQRIDVLLKSLSEQQLDALRADLAIGLHRHVEVTIAEGPKRPSVSQAFCSALPVSYNSSIAPQTAWTSFASLVLEASYEATLLAGAINAQHGGSNKVLLTLLGGGAFGNHENWILGAMTRAISTTKNLGLEVIVVSYGQPSQNLLRLLK